MKFNESFQPFLPSSAEELILRALAYIDSDREVHRKINTSDIIVSKLCDPENLDILPNDAWINELFSVSSTLFRNIREPIKDEEVLQILAIYLSAYAHDMNFLLKAASLIKVNEDSSREPPYLPFKRTHENITQFRNTPG